MMTVPPNNICSYSKSLVANSCSSGQLQEACTDIELKFFKKQKNKQNDVFAKLCVYMVWGQSLQFRYVWGNGAEFITLVNLWRTDLPVLTKAEHVRFGCSLYLCSHSKCQRIVFQVWGLLLKLKWLSQILHHRKRGKKYQWFQVLWALWVAKYTTVIRTAMAYGEYHPKKAQLKC